LRSYGKQLTDSFAFDEAVRVFDRIYSLDLNIMFAIEKGTEQGSAKVSHMYVCVLENIFRLLPEKDCSGS
jgi:hypothetical protein